KAQRDGMTLDFSGMLDRATATDPRRYAVRVWGLKRTENYGSDHVNDHAEPVTAATLAPDGRTVRLTIPGIAPTQGMEIKYSLRGRRGEPVEGVVPNTILALPK